jgi:mono/diheme cytochrome c family protein
LIAQQLHGNMGGVNGMPMNMGMGQMSQAQIAAMRHQMRPVSAPFVRIVPSPDTDALLRAHVLGCSTTMTLG